MLVFVILALAALGLFLFWFEPLTVVGLLERATPDIVYRVPTNLLLAALSFDDGPHPVFTPEALNILAANHATATFFLIGDRALLYPELVARIKAAGHEVANHYSRDGSLLRDSEAEFLANLEQTERALGLSEASQTKLFRPPGGVARSRQRKLAQSRGYTCVLGDAYPHDPMHPPVWYIRWLVTKNLAPGTIVILHDGISDPSRTLRALPQILAAGHSRGFSFVPIGELIRRSRSG